MANAVFMHKMLGDSEALIKLAEDRALGHPDIGVGTFRVVGGHIKCPQIFANFKAGRVGGDHKAGDAARLAIFAIGARKGHHMRGHMQACGPHFVAINAIARHAIAHFWHGMCVHMRRVRTMMFFSQAKGPAHPPGKHFGNEIALLLICSKVAQHQHLHEIADD